MKTNAIATRSASEQFCQDLAENVVNLNDVNYLQCKYALLIAVYFFKQLLIFIATNIYKLQGIWAILRLARLKHVRHLAKLATP